MKLALLFLFILGCVSRTCLHGGDCLELENGGFHCRCKNGFSGATCNYLSGRRKTVIDLEWYRYGLVNMVMGVWYSKDCTYVMLFPVYSLRVVIRLYRGTRIVRYDSSFNYLISLGTFILYILDTLNELCKKYSVSIIQVNSRIPFIRTCE